MELYVQRVTPVTQTRRKMDMVQLSNFLGVRISPHEHDVTVQETKTSLIVTTSEGVQSDTTKHAIKKIGNS